jgi:branched-chain amino acid transport system ATP-binding protein
VLLLDEPTEGVWIGVIQEIASRLKQLVREIALVLVEQHLELALEVADYAYVLDRGRIALEGPAHAIRNDPRLVQILAP